MWLEMERELWPIPEHQLRCKGQGSTHPIGIGLIERAWRDGKRELMMRLRGVDSTNQLTS